MDFPDLSPTYARADRPIPPITCCGGPLRYVDSGISECTGGCGCYINSTKTRVTEKYRPCASHPLR